MTTTIRLFTSGGMENPDPVLDNTVDNVNIFEYNESKQMILSYSNGAAVKYSYMPDSLKRARYYNPNNARFLTEDSERGIMRRLSNDMEVPDPLVSASKDSVIPDDCHWYYTS